MPVTKKAESNNGLSGSGVWRGILRFLKGYSRHISFDISTRGAIAIRTPLWTTNEGKPALRVCGLLGLHMTYEDVFFLCQIYWNLYFNRLLLSFRLYLSVIAKKLIISRTIKSHYKLGSITQDFNYLYLGRLVLYSNSYYFQ